MTRREPERGFTLVELMTVVAIIGILAAVALPIYQNYVKRTRMSEVVMALSGCRTAVTEVYQAGSGGSGPGAGNWGCEKAAPSSRYVLTITTDVNGKVLVTPQGFADAAIDGKIVTLTPLISGSPASAATDMGKAITTWRCGSTVDGTTVLLSILPASCQGS